MSRELARRLPSGGAQQSLRHKRTLGDTRTPRCSSTASRRTCGDSTTCMATSGNGPQIAGTNATLVIQVMGEPEVLEIAVFESFAVDHGIRET